MRETFVARLRLISFGIICCALILMGQLYLVQIVRGDDFAEKAERQYVQPQAGVFERGTIYFEDKNGETIAAATQKSGFTLAISPIRIDNRERLFERIQAHVPIDRELFMDRASRRDDPYEVVARELSEQEARALTDADIDGIILEREQWRYYPGVETAAHALGFVGFNGDTLSGRYGLERYYDDVLERESDSTYINFFAEVFSNIADALEPGESYGEGDLVLTIEPTVQGALEKTLEDVENVWGSKSVGGIIIHPKTGELYALASRPTFDPNNFQHVSDPSFYSNPLVESVFEMGSIIKPLTMAAGIDAKAVGPHTTYYDAGYLVLDDGNARISNFDGKGRGTVDMYHVLGESLNTGVAFVVSQMGNSTFARYMKSFGIGEETGIDLPGEVRGLIDNLNSPRDVEYATASFGQGIALTPIATARALAALGNGGKLITPYITKRIEYDLRPPKKIFYDAAEQVIDPETSETITRMLVRVADEFLLDGTVKLDRYSIAAKTGTAQIADPVHGGYHDDRFFHSFFGYFPAYDPEFLIFLYNEEPVGARYASQTLTEPFFDLTKFLISYYEVPPDR